MDVIGQRSLIKNVVKRGELIELFPFLTSWLFNYHGLAIHLLPRTEEHLGISRNIAVNRIRKIDNSLLVIIALKDYGMITAPQAIGMPVIPTRSITASWPTSPLGIPHLNRLTTGQSVLNGRN